MVFLKSYLIVKQKSINDYYESKGGGRPFKWQRNYFERVVRNERELENIYNYIRANPANWKDDILHENNYSPERMDKFMKSFM